MRGLSAVGDAEIVGLRGRCGHGEKRKCERCRGGSREDLRSWFHLFFSLVLQVGGNLPTKDSPVQNALRFTTAHISAELSSTMAARRIAAMPECNVQICFYNSVKQARCDSQIMMRSNKVVRLK
jgi:hypothetical protein